MRYRPLLPSLVLLAASLVGGVAPAAADTTTPTGCETNADLVDVLRTVLSDTSYTVHTEFTADDGTVVEKDTAAVVGVPTLVNARGVGALPDLVVTVLPNLDRTVTLSVLKAPLAPARLPVRVEAVFSLDGGTEARLGYDTAEVADPVPGDDPFHQVATTAPGSWSLNARIERCDAGTFLRLTQTTGARTAPLALVGTVTSVGATTDAEVALAPVPDRTVLTAAITEDEDAGSATAEFGIAPSATTAATVDARLVDGRRGLGTTTNVHAELPGLPAAAPAESAAVVKAIEEEAAGVDRHRLEFRAAERLASARVVLRQTEGTRQRLAATAEAFDLPHAFSVDIAELTQAGLTRHEMRYESEPFAGRTEKLTRLNVHADIIDAQEALQDADTTSLRAGAAGVPQDLVVSFTPPDEEAPEFLATSLSTSADGGATGPALDSLEVEVARDDDPTELGDGETLDGGEEGVFARTILRDDRLQRRQTVHLFVTNPKFLSFKKSESPAPGEVGVDQKVINARMVTDAAAPDRPFRVRLERTLVHRQPVVFSEATIDPLPADVTVDAVTKEVSGVQVQQSVDYTATEGTERVEFSTDEGPRDLLRAELHSVRDAEGVLRQVPKEIDFCLSTRTGRCSGAVLTSAQRNQVGVSLKVSTPAGQLHGSFLDCVDGPAVGECTSTNATRFKSAFFNIAPRGSFALDIDAPPIRGGEKGHVFIDTDNNAITTGGVSIRDVSSDPCAPGNQVIQGTLRDVKAQDRFAVIEVQNAACLETGIALSAERGSMSCGPGTVIDLAATKAGGNVANDFCRTP